MLSFDRRGNGPSLVLVHGITETRRAWDPLLPSLCASHDVVAVDLRGHGRSEVAPPFDLVTLASDIHAVVESLGLGRALLVGHSLGGAVVTTYATAFPCRAVVNIDQSLALGSVQELLKPLEPLLRGDDAQFQNAIQMVVGALQGPLSDDEMRRLDAERVARQEVVLGLWAPVLETPVEELQQMVEGMAAAIKVPYLSLHGSDPGPGYAEWLTGLIPTAEVEVWEGLGHYPHLVEPDRFLDRLTAFEAQLA